MKTMISKMAHVLVDECPLCHVVRRDGFNEVQISPKCRALADARQTELSRMSREDFICEVVNGRADPLDVEHHWDALYEEYEHDMPYGTRKARTGDPAQWVFERLCADYAHLIEESGAAV